MESGAFAENAVFASTGALNGWAGDFRNFDSGSNVFAKLGGKNFSIDTNAPIRGTVVSPSDRRWKTEIAPIAQALDTVTKLEGVSYRWRREEFSERNFPPRREIGVIAQQIETVAPELVSTDHEGNKSVNYALTVPLLIEAVKELKRQNDALREIQHALRDRLDQLEPERRAR